MKRQHNSLDDHTYEGELFSISTNEASLGPGFTINTNNSISSGVVKALVTDNANKIRLADPTPGTAATVTVGTTTTGAAGSPAAVTNSGTSSAAILNFSIPGGTISTIVQEQVAGVFNTATITPAGIVPTFTGTLTPPSTDGMTVSGNTLTITKKGYYHFKVSLHLNTTATVFCQMLVDGVAWGSTTQTIASTLAGVENSFNAIFTYFQTANTSHAITFHLVGDTYPTTGSTLTYDSSNQVMIAHWSTS